MPNLPSREARIARLVMRGVMPSMAERAVAEAEANGQRIPTPNEAAWDGEVTPADIEQARLWWYYTPDVPQRLRRILDARVVGAPVTNRFDPSQPRDPAETGGQWTAGGADAVPQQWGRADTERHERFPPTLPQQLNNRGGRETHERQLERKAIMERTYPGVRFSDQPYNKLALDQMQEQYGKVPGAAVPNAIYNSKFPPVSDPVKVESVRASVKKWGLGSGYVHYTTVKFDTGLSFRELFGVVRYLTEEDPYAVRQSVDRLGKNVNFALRPERGWL